MSKKNSEQPPEGRLVVTRHVGEKIVIGNDIVITVCFIQGTYRVKLGIEAPRDIKVCRKETIQEK